MENGQTESITMSMMAGGKLGATSMAGQTPLRLAVVLGKTAIQQQLEAYGQAS